MFRSFFFGRNAFGEGIGERLTALDLPQAWYVVLVPPVPIATRGNFRRARIDENSKNHQNIRLFPLVSGATISSRWCVGGIRKWRRISSGFGDSAMRA